MEVTVRKLVPFRGVGWALRTVFAAADNGAASSGIQRVVTTAS